MKTLLLDAGNTSLKWSLNAATIKQKRMSYGDKTPIECFEVLLERLSNVINSVVMVSVLGDNFIQQAEKLTINASIKFRSITSKKELAGVKVAYTEPHKLGADRLVGMIAARKLSPSACIVIDIGTATTIDAIDESGQHLGGLILPGANLCVSSLLNNTAQLATFSSDEKHCPELFSKDTTQAIASASVLGLASAIDGICFKMEREINKHSKQEISRILCGGGGGEILPYMLGDYELHENLLMIGLQELVQGKKRGG